MGYDRWHRQSLLSSLFSSGGKFSLDASEFSTSSIALLCCHWAVNTSSGPRPLEVFIKSSDCCRRSALSPFASVSVMSMPVSVPVGIRMAHVFGTSLLLWLFPNTINRNVDPCPESGGT